MNKDRVLEQLAPVLNTQVKNIEHTPRTRVRVTPEMVTYHPGSGQRSMEVTEDGVRSMANFIGLPWNIAAGLQPATFGAAASDLLERKRNYALVVKDHRVVDVIRRGKYHPINVERALKSIESGAPGLELHRALIIDNVVSLEVVGERREAVARGDLIQAGASITFSPLGTVSPFVQAFALRLSCTNGATHNTIFRKFEWGDGARGGGGEGDDIWQWFRKSVHQAYVSLDQIVQRYRAMIAEGIPSGDRAAMLEALLKQAKITGEPADTVRAMAIENPPRNSYEMLNLITYASSHLLERPEHIVRACQAVAIYTAEETHSRVCPVCHSRR